MSQQEEEVEVRLEDLSIEEQNEILKDRLQKLQDLLEETIAGEVKKIGTVKAGPDERGLYRLHLDGSGNIAALTVEGLRHIQPESEVLVCAGIITEILSEELKPEIEELDFNRIEWNDIKGLKSQVETIQTTIEGPLNYPEIYEEFGVPPLRGLALYGPPGVGKTKIAKAIASSMLDEFNPDKESFVYLKGGELLSKYVGEAEANIKNIFDSCRRYMARTGRKSIIFIDEAEAIVPIRGSRQSSDVDSTIVPTFLAEMDGITNHNPFVILATNHIDKIDPAVIRPGRIDLCIEIGRPTKEDSEEILEYYFNKTQLHDPMEDLMNATLAYIAGNTELRNKISGAELEGLVKKFTMAAINRIIKNPRSNERGITIEDLKTAIANY